VDGHHADVRQYVFTIQVDAPRSRSRVERNSCRSLATILLAEDLTGEGHTFRIPCAIPTGSRCSWIREGNRLSENDVYSTDGVVGNIKAAFEICHFFRKD
jgi:hypothetical protein